MERASLNRTGQSWQERLVRFAPHTAAAVILIILPAFLSTDLQSMMAKVLIFAIFALSFDIIFGYTGLLSLGHAAFFGVGGYAAGILIVQFGIKSFWITAPFGILMAGLVAALFGIIALQTSGMYFLLVTLALGQLVYAVVLKWTNMTGGYNGLWGIPQPDLGLPGFTWDATSFYYFVFAVFVICFILLSRLMNSPFGYGLRGVRESAARMQALGYNTWLCKYIAFVIAGLFAGVAGVLYGHHYGAIAPVQLDLSTSALVMLMVIIGGAGTLFGAVLGAGVVILVQHFASAYVPERWPLILGVTFVLAVMYARGGIGIHLLRLWRKVIYQYESVED